MANVSVTYSFTNGTTADATQVNTNFTDIINGTSDGTKDFSIAALTCSGAVSFQGNMTFGNASGDTITFTGTVASDFVPNTTATYDLGSSSVGFADLYLGNNSQIVTVRASASASASWTWSYPVNAGTSGYVLATNGSGATSWVPAQVSTSAKSADYTVLDTDGIRTILMTTSTVDRTVTLPTAADNANRIITVKKVDSAVNKCTIDGEGAETIDGSTTLDLYSQNDYVTVQSDGTGWHIISHRRQVREETKILSADVTTNTTVSDLTFTLVAGKRYRILGNFFLLASSSAASVTVLDGANTVGIIRMVFGPSGSDSQSIPFITNYTMTGTSLTFVTSSIDGSPDTLLGDGTRAETFVIVEELNDNITTTEF